MAIAREQARGLLTESEMVLFGESRNPALRTLSDRELTRRIDRVRKLRDKSRDLLQRQRLGSRERTGNKGGKSGAANERTARKGEVLDDVLQRFENRLQELERSGQSGAGKKSAGASRRGASAAKAPARKTAVAEGAGKAKKTPKRGVVAKKAVGARKAAGTGTGAKPAAARSASAKPAPKARAAGKQPAAASKRARKSPVTADQALASTRALLEAKQQRARKPRGYPGDGDAVQTDPGYQSGEARSKALELHAGEIRLEPIHGSISTRDRKNQAKRDRG